MQLMTRLGLFLDYDRLLLVQTDGGWPVVMRERLVELEKKRQSVLDISVGELLDTPRPEDKVPEPVEADPHQQKSREIDQKDMTDTIG